MTYERLKKTVVSLALTAVFILSLGLAGNSLILARTNYSLGQERWGQDPDRQYRDRQWERRREREELWRIRRLDREHQLRYRMNNSMRMVGYYDRFGIFHAYGYYDRFGFFHRY